MVMGAVVVVPGRVASIGDPDRIALEGSPNLLLIDRQPLFLAALESLLTAPPIRARVRLAHDADAGLQIALRSQVHLAFCEVRTEPMSAIEVAARLAGLSPAVPVILLGEQEDKGLLISALHTNVAGVFTKDAALEEFLVGVQTVLSGHRAVGSNLMAQVLERLRDPQRLRRSPSQLSPTEVDILTMIGQANSIAVIAATRGISHKTVRNHLANIYRKLDLRSRTEAMLCAARLGLTSN
jgi:DNA-binding NarL/FixJ family response regulator